MKLELQNRLSQLLQFYTGGHDDNLCVYQVATLLSNKGVLTKNDISLDNDFMKRTLPNANRLLFGEILPAKTDEDYLKLIQVYRKINKADVANFLAVSVRDTQADLHGAGPSGTLHLNGNGMELVTRIQSFYKDFARTRLVPWNPRSTVDLNDVYVNLIMKDGKGKTSKENYQLCLELAKTSQLPIIVQGDPGGGKTTLAKKICLDWANNLLPQFKIVLMARLRDVAEAQDFTDICIKWMSNRCSFFRESSDLNEYIEALRFTEPQGILLLLDGLDEAITDCQQLSELYKTDFVHSGFPVIITTRPYKVNDILCDHHICYIQALRPDQQIEFATKYFDSQNTDWYVRQKFLGAMHRSIDLQGALRIPLLLQLALISGYSQENYRQTDLYKELVYSLMSTFNEKHPGGKFLDIGSWETSETVLRLGKMAFEKLIEGEEGILSFTEVDLLKEEVDPIFVKMGILTMEENWSIITNGKPQKIYSFLHKTMQEFFAAHTVAASFAKFKKIMSQEVNRAASFQNSQATDLHQKKFAKAGFFSLGVKDHVQCAFCHGRMFSLAVDADPSKEHILRFPECQFVKSASRSSIRHRIMEHICRLFHSHPSICTDNDHKLTDQCVDESIFMHFNAIFSEVTDESWKQPGLQQTFLFLAGFMSDMGDTKWIEKTAGYSNLLSYLSIQIGKVLAECNAMDVEEIIKTSRSQTFIFRSSLELVPKSHYSVALYPGIFEYKGPREATSIIACDLEKVTLTTELVKKIQNIGSFHSFFLSGNTEQLKEFTAFLPSKINFLRISMSIEDRFEKNSKDGSKWPILNGVQILALDISTNGWSESYSELIQSTLGMRSLMVFGDHDVLDFREFAFMSPESMQVLELWNSELNLGETSISLLSSKLQSFVNLTTLQLSDCQLTARKVLPVLQSLKLNNPKLEWLFLDWNKGLGKDTVGFKSCCQELAEFPALLDLSLWGCGLSDSSLDALELLLNSQSLKRLWLQQNRFESQARFSKLRGLAAATLYDQVYSSRMKDPQN